MTTTTTRATRLVGLSLGLLLFAGSARGDGKITRLAQELARLRGEVEALSTRLETEKADHRSRLRSLATQKAELEVQAKREQMRLQQLRKRQEQHKQRVEQRAREQQELAPVVSRGVKPLVRAVRQGLPFKRKQRAEEIAKIEGQVKGKLLTPDAAIAQLWSRVEDELRLGRESGIYSQVIELDGKEQLVEVARIGMVALFFRTGDDRYGVARRVGDRWSYEIYENKDDWTRVAALFDAFKKQIRTGYFELPNALPTKDAP